MESYINVSFVKILRDRMCKMQIQTIQKRLLNSISFIKGQEDTKIRKRGVDNKKNQRGIYVNLRLRVVLQMQFEDTK